jgi:peptidoglycan/LPS O-acetylase OafA/YrhL
MLHNAIPKTTYSLNGVFWTLSVEEELYLAYFLLLRLRSRGWRLALGVTLLARVAWFGLGFVLHRRWGIVITIWESAAAAWFCWALGALAVEGALGVIKLPPWTRQLRFAGLLFLIGIGLEILQGTADAHSHVGHFVTFVWQPLFGVAFFIVVNWAVSGEAEAQRRPFVRAMSWLGLCSYSLYLLHELVVFFLLNALQKLMGWSPTTTSLLAVFVFAPACIPLAYMFFRLFEKPFMSSR